LAHVDDSSQAVRGIIRERDPWRSQTMMDFNLPDNIIPILAIVSVFSFMTISSIVYYGFKAYCVARLCRLKERLLESGLSGGEIERIVNAGNPNRDEAHYYPQKQKSA
jgi:hypothetical protein